MGQAPGTARAEVMGEKCMSWLAMASVEFTSATRWTSRQKSDA